MTGRDCSWTWDVNATPRGFAGISPDHYQSGLCVCSSDRTGTPDIPNSYNCIAFAAGIMNRWWWPHQNRIFYDWPKHLPRKAIGEETIEDFISAFEHLGYVECANSQPESGFEKVAIYADQNGIPTHAARQLANGNWKSKLGAFEDIEHRSLDFLNGDEPGGYGVAAVFLKRAL